MVDGASVSRKPRPPKGTWQSLNMPRENGSMARTTCHPYPSVALFSHAAARLEREPSLLQATAARLRTLHALYLVPLASRLSNGRNGRSETSLSATGTACFFVRRTINRAHTCSHVNHIESVAHDTILPAVRSTAR